MKERPILFSAEMVRAILDTNKTQTRRMIRGATGSFWGHAAWYPVVDAGRIIEWRTHDGEHRFGAGAPQPRCPYGQPGDRLWVRETWGYWGSIETPEWVIYRADADKSGVRWRPSIFMPRWASRINLEITGVRVERLQAISRNDAIAEGIAPLFTEEEMRGRPEFESCRGDWKNYLWHGLYGQHGMGNSKSDAWPHQNSGYNDPRGSYSSLWESINGPGSWDSNPWVWVVEFALVPDSATASGEEG